MIIMGIQFGHDGSVALIKDGKILSFIYRERFSRVKHAIGVSDSDIDLALAQANITIEQIDYISICDPISLEEKQEVKGRTLIALAVKIGPARLIDNCIIGD